MRMRYRAGLPIGFLRCFLSLLVALVAVTSPALGYISEETPESTSLDPALAAVVPRSDWEVPSSGLLGHRACSTAAGADYDYLGSVVPDHWRNVVGEDESPLTAWYGEEQNEAKDRVQEWVRSNAVLGAMTFYLDLLRQSYVVTVDPDLTEDAMRAIVSVVQAVAGDSLRVLVQPACVIPEELEQAADLASKMGALGIRHSVRFNRSATKYEIRVVSADFSRASSLVPDGPALSLVELPGEGRLNDRMNDGSPHYGGARLTPTYTTSQDDGWCTAGFTMVNGSSHRMVTAGHCSQHWPSPWSWYSGNKWFGGSETSYNWWSTRDIMLLGTTGSTHTYARIIHVDPPAGDTRIVNSKGVAGLDTSVCLSGHVSKAKCGLIVDGYGDFRGVVNDLVEPYTGHAYDPLYRQYVNQPGDSGAPVYQKVTSCDCARIFGMNLAELPGAENTIFIDTSTLEAAISPWKVKTSGAAGSP